MIETARMILRPHTLADFEHWYAMFSDRALFRYISSAAPSREDGWNRLLRYAGHWALLKFGMFAVFEKTGGVFLGEVGFADFHRGLGERFDVAPEAAWIFTGAAHGKGLATEAVAAALGWIKVNHATARTVCLIGQGNAPSIKLAGTLGYTAFDICTYRGDACMMFERFAS